MILDGYFRSNLLEVGSRVRLGLGLSVIRLMSKLVGLMIIS